MPDLECCATKKKHSRSLSCSRKIYTEIILNEKSLGRNMRKQTFFCLICFFQVRWLPYNKMRDRNLARTVMSCQNLRSVPLTCVGFLQFVALGCFANAPKIFAAPIIRMEMNMVKIHFPYTTMNAQG